MKLFIAAVHVSGFGTTRTLSVLPRVSGPLPIADFNIQRPLSRRIRSRLHRMRIRLDGTRVRLFGIDAPERGQPGASESRVHAEVRESGRYEDGDPLNLRRSNLYLANGPNRMAREEFAFAIAEARAAVMASLTYCPRKSDVTRATLLSRCPVSASAGL